MNKLLLLLLSTLFFISCNTSEQEEPSALEVAYGRVVRVDSFPSSYVAARTVDILLPEGYSPKKKYPVLYMHDGQMLYDSTSTWNKQEWGVDEAVGKLVKEEKIPACIVVGAWNAGAGRHGDYFPQKAFEQLSQSFRDSLLTLAQKDSKGRYFKSSISSDNYLKFLTEELKPYIDKNYSTLPDKQHTAVAGSSMGGLISMYALCEYPEVFGSAACLSTHWPGAMPYAGNPIPQTFINYLAENLPKPGSNKIYFDFGTETLDQYYEPHQLRVDSVMREKGFTEEHWQTRKFEGEDHSENSWKARLHIPLTFILSQS